MRWTGPSCVDSSNCLKVLSHNIIYTGSQRSLLSFPACNNALCLYDGAGRIAAIARFIWLLVVFSCLHKG